MTRQLVMPAPVPHGPAMPASAARTSAAVAVDRDCWGHAIVQGAGGAPVT
ncbi:hypothetical protein ABZ208_31175 [Streptomyces sp. NPDC006208]